MNRFPLAIPALALALATDSGPAAAGGDFARWERALADHPLADRAGNVVRLGELQGEVVVVSFWASWCKPCKKELLTLNEWPAEAVADGLPTPRLVAVSIDTDERKAMRFVDEAAIRMPVFLDGPDGLARDLDLPSLPLTLVLDRTGRVAAVAHRESELPTQQRTVRALMAEPAATDRPARDRRTAEASG